MQPDNSNSEEIQEVPLASKTHASDRPIGWQWPKYSLLYTSLSLTIICSATVLWLQHTFDPHTELIIPTVLVDLTVHYEVENQRPLSTVKLSTNSSMAQTIAPKATPKSTSKQAIRHKIQTPPPLPKTKPQLKLSRNVADKQKRSAVSVATEVSRVTKLTTTIDDLILGENSNHSMLRAFKSPAKTPLQIYARPHKKRHPSSIAIIIGSLGLSRLATLTAIQRLPGTVTLALTPYGRNLQDYSDQARAAGHEVLLQVPMEPLDYPQNDPGPHTLLTSLTPHKNNERLYWILDRLTGYVGIMTYMGSRFTKSESALRPLMSILRERGLLFVDSQTTKDSRVAKVGKYIGTPAIIADRFIDTQASRLYVDSRLIELEQLAKKKGQAIGVGFPYPVTLERISHWAVKLNAKGIDLVPVSALLPKAKNYK